MSVNANGSMEPEVMVQDIRERIINKGFTEKNLEDCLKTYADDEIWMVMGQDRSKLRWLRLDDEN